MSVRIWRIWDKTDRKNSTVSVRYRTGSLICAFFTCCKRETTCLKSKNTELLHSFLPCGTVRYGTLPKLFPKRFPYWSHYLVPVAVRYYFKYITKCSHNIRIKIYSEDYLSDPLRDNRLLMISFSHSIYFIVDSYFEIEKLHGVNLFCLPF